MSSNPSEKPRESLDAREALGPVYEELRAIAGSYLAGGDAGVTLQPTMIVHEAYARLAVQSRAGYRDSAHFRAVACTMMRRILVDHARARAAAKRGGDGARMALEPDIAPAPDLSQIRILATDEALTKLARHDQRAARMVELRFFGGLTVDEAAAVLGISPRQVDDDWRYARAWLARELGGDGR